MKNVLRKVKNASVRIWENHRIFVVLGAAFAVKLALSLLFRGVRPDVDAIIADISNVGNYGAKYYEESGSPREPGLLYIYYYLNLFKTWFNLPGGGAAMLFFIRLPSLLFGVATGYVLYSAGSKYVSRGAGLAVAVLYLFNPAVIMLFDIWGGFDAAYVFFLVLTFKYVLDKKIPFAAVSYTLAVFFGARALVVAPLVLVYLVVAFIKAAKLKIGDGEGGSVLEPKLRPLWEVPLAVAIFFFGLFLISLPFTANEVGDGKVFYYVTVFARLCYEFQYFTYNGFGIYGFTDRNGASASSGSSWPVIALYFVLAAVIAAVYAARRNRANLVLLSAFIALAVAVFMMNASPLGLAPVLALLILALIATGDRRLAGQYVIISLLSLFNAGAVMVNGLYLNGLPSYLFNSENSVTEVNYAGTPLLGGGVMLVGSILAVLAAIYCLITAMDITVSNRRKIFIVDSPDAPLFPADSFFSIFR